MYVIEQKIKQLPQDMQQEVYDFIDFLLTRKRKAYKSRKRLKLDWMGGLKEYRE
ncbi:MAG: DUF2281 domain-containing protein [Candidatus Marinimicrobia bacterium]|nr:DUF2281 domain-containing protein [Candidatus Neomarinimicrobiota bacterium]